MSSHTCLRFVYAVLLVRLCGSFLPVLVVYKHFTMDEDYDELMGPRPGQDMRKVFKDDPSPLPQDAIRRTSSSNSGPPPTLFHSMPDRWAKEEENMNESQARQATGRKNVDIMSFDEEEDMPDPPGNSSPQGIRQEALRMLEVAESGTYSVHRTVTGGFMAEPRSMGEKKRVPTALAGLGSIASGSARSSKPRVPSVYRDTPVEENYHYGDDSYGDRFAAQQVKEEKKEASNTWSSRYSVDDTLFAMSGGSTKSNKTSSFLDKLDSQNERRSARNMFMASPSKDSSIFGSGFSFRKKSVFGKQGATTPDNNLRTVWMDAGASNSPARSWMDELRDKQSKRRKVLILAALVVAFIIVMVAVLSRNNSSGDVASSTAKTGPAGEEAITFYVTSDTPRNGDEEKALAKNLAKVSPQADFFVHLGSIQDPEVTQCEPAQYEKVASILMKSPVPVYVLPGQQDWNNCPDQDEGWNNWWANFMEFDEYFDKVSLFGSNKNAEVFVLMKIH